MSDPLEAVHQRLSAVLGQESTQPLGVVEGRDIERFAVASQSPPGWSGTGDQRVAPPLYLSSVMGWGSGPAEDELRPDGSGPDETRGLPLDGVRLMGAGQDLEFHQPVREGTAVVAHTSLAEVELKYGRSGSLLIMKILRHFTDADGQPLVTCRESFIAR